MDKIWVVQLSETCPQGATFSDFHAFQKHLSVSDVVAFAASAVKTARDLDLLHQMVMAQTHPHQIRASVFMAPSGAVMAMMDGEVEA